MKEQGGKDLIIYATDRSERRCWSTRLLDELQFAIHPVFVAEGTPLLRQGAMATLELTGTKTLGTGVIVVRYRPAGG
jgi:dihydrofolate reductase